MATQGIDFSDLGAQPVRQQGQASAPLDFTDLGGKRVVASTAAVPDATISARPSGVQSWLEDLQGDIKYGSGNTLPGRVLRKMGAPGIYSGVPESVGDLVGGVAIGPVNVAHGSGAMFDPGSTLKQRVRGFNETVRGAAQTAAPLMAVAAPEVLPQLVPSAAVYGSAQHGVQRGAEALGADPDTAEAIGDVATIGLPLAKAGMPRVGRFTERNAPRIGKTAGVTSAAVAGGEAIAKGYPWGALPAAGAAYKYATPLATKIARWSGRRMQSVGNTPLLPHELIDAPTAPRLIDQVTGTALPAGQYEAPPSSVRPPAELSPGVIEGEYVDESSPASPPPTIRGRLRAGQYNQPSSPLRPPRGLPPGEGVNTSGSVYPPELPRYNPAAIPRATRASSFADFREDQAIQDMGRADLEAHGTAARAQESRRAWAASTRRTPKSVMADEFNASRTRLIEQMGGKPVESAIEYTPSDDLTPTLRESLKIAMRKKAGH